MGDNLLYLLLKMCRREALLHRACRLDYRLLFFLKRISNNYYGCLSSRSDFQIVGPNERLSKIILESAMHYT